MAGGLQALQTAAILFALPFALVIVLMVIALWRALREDVREDVLTHGFDTERGTFVQHYDTTEVDASLLLLPLVGFLEPDDPRIVELVEANLPD